MKENAEVTERPKQGLSFGTESLTSSHSFQVFLTTRDNIVPGKDLAHGRNGLLLKNPRLGFNMRIKLGDNKKQ